MLIGIYDNLQKKFAFGTVESVLTQEAKWVSLERNGAVWWRMVTACF
jgi:hypothetical protein